MRERRLLVVSHVLPFPRRSGQNQRVFYTLQAARHRFHVTFASVAPAAEQEDTRRELLRFCDEVVLLPSRYAHGKVWKASHRAIGTLYRVGTGLNSSNYVLGRLEFTPARVATLVDGRSYDCALYEYWHTWRSTAVLRARAIPTILDTHNILWQAQGRHLDALSYVPQWCKRWNVRRYRAHEEKAWAAFDGLVAINRREYGVIRSTVPERSPVFYAPMGIDLDRWPLVWRAPQTVRVGYYGGLGSPRNQKAALECCREIMPEIWKVYPSAELWLVGSNPSQSVRALESDPRVKVTGYVENVQETLGCLSVVICPWTGTYGFRSRLVEVMALGVPLVASHDAVAGMELDNENGILLTRGKREMARRTLKLLADPDYARRQSRLGRQRSEQLYSVENTYGKLIGEICDWLETRQRAHP